MIKNIEFRKNYAAITAFPIPFFKIYQISKLSHFMKYLLILIVSLLFSLSLLSQDLQLHYDLRHTVDPQNNPANFPTLYFQYFKLQDTGKSDSGKSFIKPGSFLCKMEADMLGDQQNIGKGFIQVSQSLRCWKPRVYLSLQYSGGLGVTQPAQYSYYITNTFAAGAAYSFQWKKAWFSSILYYQVTQYTKPSHDPLYTLYWWKSYFHYKLEFAGDFSIWTANKNQGDKATSSMRGKMFYFFAEPQVWYNLNKSFALGSKINMYYHVNTTDNQFQVYPTVAIKYKL